MDSYLSSTRTMTVFVFASINFGENTDVFDIASIKFRENTDFDVLPRVLQ